MNKFPHINQFSDIVKRVKYFCDKYAKEIPTLEFIGKVKLHGANAGVRRNNGIYSVQGRNRIISPQYDHYDFAKRINNIPVEQLNSIFDLFGSVNDDITMYGEYIGKGIQSKVATSEIERQWVVYAVSVNGVYTHKVSNVRNEQHGIYNINMTPTYNLRINFNDLEDAKSQIQSLVDRIESECPWGALFGRKGTGEGLVWHWKGGPEDTTMWFKTKGTKHSKNPNPRPAVEIEPEKLQSINKFIDRVVHEDRLTQALDYVKEMNGESDVTIKHLGQFLKWISQDILREEVDLLEVNNLQWKDVNKEVTIKAKQWYLKSL